MSRQFTSEATRAASQLEDLARRAQFIDERTAFAFREPGVRGVSSAIRRRAGEIVGSSKIVLTLLRLDRSDR